MYFKRAWGAPASSTLQDSKWGCLDLNSDQAFSVQPGADHLTFPPKLYNTVPAAHMKGLVLLLAQCQ